MNRHVPQSIDTITVGIVDVEFLRLGAGIIVEPTLPEVLRGSLFGSGLVGVLEAAFVGNLALLAMVTRPLTVALSWRLELLDGNGLKKAMGESCGRGHMGKGREGRLLFAYGEHILCKPIDSYSPFESRPP